MKISIVALISVIAALSGCSDGTSKIVETKEGTFVITFWGSIKKIENNRIIPVEKEQNNFTNGVVLSKIQTIKGNRYDLKFEVKTKILNDNTLYQIAMTIPVTERNKNPSSFFKEDADSKQPLFNFDGVTSLIVSFKDADGFDLSSDTFKLNNSWMRTLDDNGVVNQLSLSDVRVSSRIRAAQAKSLHIGWTGGQ